MSETSQKQIEKVAIHEEEEEIDLEKEIWGYKELAKYFGYKVSTLRSMYSRDKEDFPPRIKKFRTPKWYRNVVKNWCEEQSFPLYKKLGRPRNIQSNFLARSSGLGR